MADKSRPLIKPPQRHSLPPVGHEGGPDEWRPYPDYAEGTEGHSTCLFNTLSCLSLIAYEVATLSQGDVLQRPRAETESKVTALRERLRHCSDRWPTCLKTNLEAPHILCLQ